MVKKRKDKNLIIYGAGRNGMEWALNENIKSHIYAFVDSDSKKIGNNIEGIPIISIDSLGNDDYRFFISVSSKYYEEIKALLKDKGRENSIVNSPYPEEVVKVMDNAYINSKCRFEGANYIGFNSTLVDCELGFASYVSEGVSLSNVKCGKYSSIAEGVSLIIGSHPSKNKFVSTHPAFFSVKNEVSQVKFADKQKFEEFSYTKNGYVCEIGNDVWIGKNTLIKEGLTIGDGAIIGAGAVVVKDVAPYSIVGGVPAEIIRYRFSEEEIQFLKNLKWWNKDIDWINEKSKYFDDLNELRKNL